MGEFDPLVDLAWPPPLSCADPGLPELRAEKPLSFRGKTLILLEESREMTCQTTVNLAELTASGTRAANGRSPHKAEIQLKEKKIMAAKRKPNAAFMKPVQPDDKLAAVVGSKPLPRTELTKKLWAYIKKNGLQDKKVRTQINADDALKAVFGGKGKVSMFEMTKLVSKHVK